MRHLRSTLDVGDKKALEAIFLRAQELKRQRRGAVDGRAVGRGSMAPTLAGRVIGMLFEKPSTRTRVSFESGIKLLGGATVVLQGRDIWLGAREAGITTDARGSLARDATMELTLDSLSGNGGGEVLRDTARVLGGSLDALIVRPHGPHATIEELARHAGVPVVNGMSDLDHPCQVLTDLFTIYERRERPFESKLAFVGDSIAMANGYLALSILTGLDLRLCLPESRPGFHGQTPGVDADLLKRALTKANVLLTRSPIEAVAGADVVATAAWSRLVPAGFCVDDALLAHASPDVTVLHPLPAHRGQEITDDVLEGTRSVAFQQAQNRLPVQQALLEALLT